MVATVEIFRVGEYSPPEDPYDLIAEQRYKAKVIAWLKERLNQKLRREAELRESAYLVIDPGAEGRREMALLTVAFQNKPKDRVLCRLRRMAKHGRLPMWTKNNLESLWIVSNPLLAPPHARAA